MDDPRLSISFEEPDAAEAEDPRITLEAEASAGSRPTLDDIDQMLARAASGLSARTVVEERCRAARFGADGEVILTLAALVWPSRADLHYDLDLPEEATPGPVTVIREERQYKAWASGGGVIELPWRMEIAAPAWAYGCWDASGNPMPGPPLRHDQARVIMEGERAREAHGIVAVHGAAVGFRHEFSLVFGKIDPDTGATSSIDIESVPVTARWIGADGEEETAGIDIPVPDCAKTLLAACDDGRGLFVGDAWAGEGRERYEVAYSACDGRVLGIRRVSVERRGG